MPPRDRVERRLAAIFAADVAGYSRFMGADEIGTLHALTARRKVMERLIAQHRGRIANTAGDSVLAEFPSVVEAVRCALEVQEQIAGANARAPESHRLQFRIGVHMGDVMVQAGDLFGDGVNIAARLQALAEPGSVYVSGEAFQYARKALRLSFTDLGQQTVKNIEESPRVYSVRLEGRPTPAAAKVEPEPLPLPDKPSIAVLPFNNMSDDSEQEYFADGVVEDIITALSHFPRLFVIARNSTFTYKERGVDVRDVGRELGVRYVLEGSVRRAGQRLRITGQLIDAQSGVHLWADRYDGLLEEVFELQDRVAESVVGAIAPRVTAAEVERAKRKRPENLDAYDLYLRALPMIRDMTLEGNKTAIELVERALELDQDYAVAAGLGAWAYTLRVAHNWRTDPEKESHRGVQLGRAAIARGENDADALAMGGYAVAFLGAQLHEGLAAIERAIELNPNGAVALAHAGWVRSYLGQAEAATRDFEKSIRLSPLEPTLFRAQSGLTYCCLLQRDFEGAVEWGRRALQGNPNFTPTHRALAAALGHLGRVEEGRAVVDRLLELVPGLTIEIHAKQSVYRHSGQLDLLLDGLRKSGMPERSDQVTR